MLENQKAQGGHMERTMFRRWRQLSGLSLSRAARRTRVDVGLLSRFENDLGDLRPEVIAKLRTLLVRELRSRQHEIEAVLAETDGISA